MWFLTFIWDILMTFLSTVSVLASSIGWLMSQLANLMFFLLQLLIISTTVPLSCCWNVGQQRRGLTQTLPAFKTASVERVNALGKMVGNILYRVNTVHDVYHAHCCLFLKSLKAIIIIKKAQRLFCIFQPSIRLYVHLEGNFSKTIGSQSQHAGVTKAPSARRKKRLFFHQRLRLFEERFFLFPLAVFCTPIQRGKWILKHHNNIQYKNTQ